MRSCFAFVTIVLLCSARAAVAPADFRAVAHDFYEWNEVVYPVTASSLGDHRFDARLTDYRMSEVVRRRQHVSELLATVSSLASDGWSKEDRVDRLLFVSQLAAEATQTTPHRLAINLQPSGDLSDHHALLDKHAANLLPTSSEAW